MNLEKKKIYGLIGFPVSHSLSSLMHNAAFSYLKINSEYKLFELTPEELEGFLKSLFKKNIYGLNVTIPYKEKVIPFLDNLSKEARLIGAVNTIKVFRDRLEGFNTDGEGFLKHLRQDLGFNPEGKNIVIIGAGGASKAISVYLCKSNPKSIGIYDLDKAKTEPLVKHLKENFPNLEIRPATSLEELKIQNSDLLVNATPIGMKETDPCVLEESVIHKNMLVYDLIYNPKETKLLKIAKQKGARTSNGLGMLLYQGARAFNLWTGEEAPVEIMRQALNEGVKKL